MTLIRIKIEYLRVPNFKLRQGLNPVQCITIGFSWTLNIYMSTNQPTNQSIYLSIYQSIYVCVVCTYVTIDNGSVRFESVELKSFKTEPLKKLKLKPSQKPCKLNGYKKFKLKPNGLRNFQTFKPLQR